MSKKVIIEDFVEDLNYALILLDITNVDREILRARLNKDRLNKVYRLNSAEFLYVDNCDYQGEEIERNGEGIFGLTCYVEEDGFSLYLLQYDEDLDVFYYNV